MNRDYKANYYTLTILEVPAPGVAGEAILVWEDEDGKNSVQGKVPIYWVGDYMRIEFTPYKDKHPKESV